MLFLRYDLYFYYDEEYAKGALKNRHRAKNFCKIADEKFQPLSVIDFGCGIGVVLSYFEENGKDILGVDGSARNKKYSLINKNNFLVFDLRKKFNNKRKYDLCFCLEVAEHIEEKYSDRLIQSLTEASPTIIFTAAPPEQTGDCHFNLKPYEWWIEKFKKFGYSLDIFSTNDFKNRLQSFPEVPCYYQNNVMIFRKNISC
jgi:SAM-dependent methyltransferase